MMKCNLQSPGVLSTGSQSVVLFLFTPPIRSSFYPSAQYRDRKVTDIDPAVLVSYHVVGQLIFVLWSTMLISICGLFFLHSAC